MVFNGGGDDVLALMDRGSRCTEQSQVIAFCAAACEHPLVRRTTQKARDGIARAVNNLFGGTSEQMHTGRIAVFFKHHIVHNRSHLRMNRG
ncbi:hypothetical protein D3C73_1293290 [compost metagenome]